MGCVNQHSVTVHERKTKFVIVGLSGAGKTALYEYIKTGQFVETTSTVGLNVDYSRKDYMLFDLAGRVPNLWCNYYENLDGLIIVVDSSNKEQLYQVKEELLRINRDIQYLNVGYVLTQIVVLVMFTKQDLSSHLDNKTLIEESGIYSVLEADMIVQMCSAKTGQGVEDGLNKLVNLVQKQRKLIRRSSSKQGQKLVG